MNSTSGEGLPKRLRLRKRREYLSVQRTSNRVVTSHFIVFARGNGGGPTRMGVTVSRKVGRANVRNRVKRLVREAFRRNTEKLPKGIDMVLVARQGRPASVYQEVVSEMISAAGELQSRAGDRRNRRRRRR